MRSLLDWFVFDRAYQDVINWLGFPGRQSATGEWYEDVLSRERQRIFRRANREP
jgi:hypothetical protein